MRETQFPTVSLGSVKPEAPSVEDLGEWIAKIKGNSADLTLWELETTLAGQPECVANPCAAGEFYSDRIREAFGINDAFSGEFDEHFDEIGLDIGHLLKVRRHFAWSVLPDAVAADCKEFDEENYADALKHLCRFMRDNGVDSHVLCGAPSEILLETFRGLKYLWVCEPADFEKLLEVSSTLVCGKEDITLVEDLNDSYLIRKVLVKDADREAMERLLETFDSDRLYVCGTGPENERKEYWETLAAVSARLTDK